LIVLFDGYFVSSHDDYQSRVMCSVCWSGSVRPADCDRGELQGIGYYFLGILLVGVDSEEAVGVMPCDWLDVVED